ncbi:MAG: T9SS type A sorting domain-containing protein [Saprospiraceae bacterium]|nr:T9SS type A sorting domain-containing protein [Saprospiraceae bacterium]
MKSTLHKALNPLYIYIYIMLICLLAGQTVAAQSCVGNNEPLAIPEVSDCGFDPAHKDILPIVTIYVNVYFQGPEGKNFTPDGSNGSPNGIEWANQMIYSANETMSNLQNFNNGLPAITGDSRIRFALYSEPDNLDDIYGGVFFSSDNPTIEYSNEAIEVIVKDGDIMNGDTTLNGFGGGSEITMKNFYYYFTLNKPSYGGWYAARLFTHEVGHLINLCHSFYPDNSCVGIDLDPFFECKGTAQTGVNCKYGAAGCDFWNAPTHNIMSYSGQARDVLTPCQWKTAYGSALNSKSKAFSKECVLSGTPTIIPPGANELWDYANVVMNKIIVSPTATLTIDCKVQFSSEAGIEVQRGGKLIVSHNGVLTNLCDGYRWQGIKVWGNTAKAQPDPNATLLPDDAGVVILLGGSQIINANTGISTTAALPWPQSKSYYGGLIKATGADFINCRKGCEFMKYDYPNNSSFEGCEFYENASFIPISGSDNKTGGVTIWDCEGISFRKNLFTNLDSYGILGIDFSCDVTEGNIFKNVNTGISAKATYEYSSNINIIGSIDPTKKNKFENNLYHIYSNNLDYNEGLMIEQNSFVNGIVGIVINNSTKLKIDKNAFYNHETAINVNATGNFNNSVICNSITTGCKAIVINGANTQFQFIDNTFENYKYDLDLQSGSIDGNQGLPGSPAENCFSDIVSNPMTELVNMRVPNPSSAFAYWVDKNLVPATSCQYPKTYGVNYYTLKYTDNSSKGCNLDYTIPPGILPPSPPYTLGTYNQYKQLTNIAQQTCQNSPTDSIAQWQYYVLGRQTQSILEWLIDSARVNHDNNLQHQVFDAEGSIISKHKRFGLYMRNNEYTNAINLLNTFPDSTLDDREYKYIQRANLARLSTDSVQFVPSIVILDSLTVIRAKNTINSDFSDALLMLFGRSSVDPILHLADCGGNNENVPRESKPYKNEQTESIYGYPNPTSGVFTIQINNSEVSYNILEINSASGKILTKYDIKGKNTIEINTSEFSNGLYICKLNNTVTGRTIGIKMIVQH